MPAFSLQTLNRRATVHSIEPENISNEIQSISISQQYNDQFWIECDQYHKIKIIQFELSSPMHLDPNSARREVLWNIVQPGDPFDIKRSMIAIMPGDRHVFMGDHLEMVCLLQAAEIERLCQYLDQYKLRYRELERRELDRHSYEIQIKELTQQIAEEGSFRIENGKLKDFLKKQSAQIDELRNMNSNKHEYSLQKNYENALLQIETLMKQLTISKEEKRIISMDIQQYIARITAVQTAKNREIEEIRDQLKDSNRLAFERQKRELIVKFETHFSQLQFQNRKNKESIQLKNLQIQQIQLALRQMESQKSSGANNEYIINEQIQLAIADYENKYALLGQEIERLNLVLRDKSGDLSTVQTNYRELQFQFSKKDLQLRDYQFRIQTLETSMTQSTTTIREYKTQLESSRNNAGIQIKVKSMTSQLERINEILRQKVDESSSLTRRIKEYEYESRNIQIIRRQNEDLKRDRNQLVQIRRKLGEYQGKMSMYKLQVERVNSSLTGRNSQISTYENRNRSLQQELENYRRKVSELEHSMSTEWQVKVSSYEQKIYTFNQQITEYQNKTGLLRQETERVTQMLRAKTQELMTSNNHLRNLQVQGDNYKRQIYEMKNSVAHEMQDKVSDFERRVNAVSKENQEYRLKLTEISEINRKMNEDSRVSKNQWRNMQTELQGSRRKYTEFESSITYEWQNKVSLYEQKITQFSHENDDLRKRVMELTQVNQRLPEYENQIAMLSQEIDRLGLTLRTKSDDLNNNQNMMRALASDLQTSRRKYGEFESSITYELQNKVNGYEQRIVVLTQESEEMRRRLHESDTRFTSTNQEMQRFGQGMRQLENINRNLQVELENSRRRFGDSQRQIMTEWQTKVTTFERRIVTFTQENEQLRVRLQEIQNRFNGAGQEIERLNHALRTRDEDHNGSEVRIRTLTQDLENHRRKMMETESSMSHQWTTKTTMYEQKIVLISKENDEFKRRLQEFGDINRKVAEYESRVSFLTQEIERLNQTLRAKGQDFNASENRNRNFQQELELFKRKIVEVESTHSHQWQNKITTYEQRITTFSRDNDDLKRLLAEAENRIGLMGQEIERLNTVSRNFQQEIQTSRRRQTETESSMSQQWHSKVTVFEQKIYTFTQENEQLRRQLNHLVEANRTIPEYENKISMSLKELERLNIIIERFSKENNVLTQRLTEIDILKHTIGNAQEQINRANIDNKNLSQEMRAYNQLKNRFTIITREHEELVREYRVLGEGSEKKGFSMTQEIQRLNHTLKIKVEEIGSYEVAIRKLQNQSEGSKRRIVQMEHSMTHQWTSKINIYQQKITVFGHQNEQLRRRLTEAEQRIAMLSQELERVNQSLRVRGQEFSSSDTRNRTLQQELQNFKRRISEMQSSMTHEWHSKVTTYEQTIANINRENQQIRRRLNEMSENSSRKIAEYDNRVAQMNQEIERLNVTLRGKVDQSNNIRNQLDIYHRKVTEVEQSKSYEWQNKITSYQQRISSSSQELQQLRIRLKQAENRMTMMSQETERLNQALRGKSEEFNSYDVRFKNLQQELQVFKRKTMEQENSTVQEWRSKTTVYEQRISIFTKQSEQYKRKIAEYENRIALMSQEMERLNIHNREYSEKSYGMNSEIEIFRRKEVQMASEIERVNISLKTKTEEFLRIQSIYSELKIRYEQYELRSGGQDEEHRKLHQAYTIVSNQYESSKIHITEYETSIKKLYGEFERLQAIMHQIREENTALKGQLQESHTWREKNRILSVEINRLIQLTQQQTGDLQDVRIRLSDDISLQKRINEHMALLVVLFAEIESLRKRVQDKEKEVEEVRRSSLAPFKSA